MFNVKIRGGIAFDTFRLNKELERIASRGAREAESRIVYTLDEVVSPGIIRRLWNPVTGSRQEHQASLPGDPPNTFTGRLSDSVRTGINTKSERGQNIVEITAGASTPYAKRLEFGGGTLEARPYLAPGLAWAMEKIRPDIDDIASRSIIIKRGVQKRGRSKKEGRPEIDMSTLEGYLEGTAGLKPRQTRGAIPQFERGGGSPWVVFTEMPEQGVHFRKNRDGTHTLVANPTRRQTGGGIAGAQVGVVPQIQKGRRPMYGWRYNKFTKEIKVNKLAGNERRRNRQMFGKETPF